MKRGSSSDRRKAARVRPALGTVGDGRKPAKDERVGVVAVEVDGLELEHSGGPGTGTSSETSLLSLSLNQRFMSQVGRCQRAPSRFRCSYCSASEIETRSAGRAPIWNVLAGARSTRLTASTDVASAAHGEIAQRPGRESVCAWSHGGGGRDARFGTAVSCCHIVSGLESLIHSSDQRDELAIIAIWAGSTWTVVMARFSSPPSQPWRPPVLAHTNMTRERTPVSSASHATSTKRSSKGMASSPPCSNSTAAPPFAWPGAAPPPSPMHPPAQMKTSLAYGLAPSSVVASASPPRRRARRARTVVTTVETLSKRSPASSSASASSSRCAHARWL
jgi:hypothetical protein